MSSIVSCLAFGLLLLLARTVSAAPLSLGVLSFDVFIPPAPGAPGVNVFNIYNFTGDPGSGGFALPPDFPAFTPLTFLSAMIVLTDEGGFVQTISLGDIPPGVYSPTDLVQFADTIHLARAVFSANLSTTAILLSDGSTFVSPSSMVSTVLLPSSGQSLAVGTDFAIITASNIPEPGGSDLLSVGLLALIALSRRRSFALFLRSLGMFREE